MTDPESITTEPERGGALRGTRLAVLGLLMVAALGAIWLVAGAIWGLDLGESAGFLVPAIVIPSIAAFLIVRFGTWARIVGIAVALLVLGLLWFTAFGLFEPASFFDFLGGLLVVPGAVIAIVGCVQGIRSARGRGAATSSSGGDRAVRVILAVVGGLALVSAVLTFVGRSTVDASEASAEVTLKDFTFEVGDEGLAVDGGSTVYVENGDPFLHTFTVDDLDIDVAIGPSSQVLVEIPAEAGTYTLYCRPHTANPDDPGEDDMATTLTVG